jgi:hypothetical protein
MWRHDPTEVMVIADGRCKFIGEAKWNEVGYAQEPLPEEQEPLPEEMRVLLCLIDGAERRQNLLRRWSGEAFPGPPSADDPAVILESPTHSPLPRHRQGAHDTPALAAPGLLAPARECAQWYRHHCTR